MFLKFLSAIMVLTFFTAFKTPLFLIVLPPTLITVFPVEAPDGTVLT
jgi:hypothetical protein